MKPTTTDETAIGRALLKCNGCGRVYLGVINEQDMGLIAGERCVACGGAEFSIVEHGDE